MAIALSDDLHGHVVFAVERGESRRAISIRFGVSYSFVHR